MNPFWFLLSAMAVPGVPEIRNQVLALDDGNELRYAISAPRDSSPRPLVLALHYGWQGQLPPGYGRAFLDLLIAPALRELDAIIVAPDCPDSHWTQPRGERALLALIEHVHQTHAVDSGRIVVTGFSVGAMGTWFMASRHPDLFSAAIPIAGPPILKSVPEPFAGLEEAQRFLSEPNVDWPAALHRMPILAIHSRSDELVPFALIDRAVQTLSASGGQVELIALERVGHFETPRYVEDLARAVPWLQEVWRTRSAKNGDRD